MFQKQKYISKTDRKKLAISLGLKESQVREGRAVPVAPDLLGGGGHKEPLHLPSVCCTWLCAGHSGVVEVIFMIFSGWEHRSHFLFGNKSIY